MKRKSITVYSIVIVSVFAAVIIFLSYKLGCEYAAGKERTGREFDRLASSARNALLRYDVSSPDFCDAFSKACGNYGDYAFIILKNASKVIFVYPENAESSEIRASRLSEIHSSSFRTGEDTYILTASMYLIRPSSVFYYARFSFIIILALTALTLILIIYLEFANSKYPVSSSSDIIEEKTGAAFSETAADNADLPFEDDLPFDSGITSAGNAVPKNETQNDAEKSVQKISYGEFENDLQDTESEYVPPETPFWEDEMQNGFSQNDFTDRFSPLTGFHLEQNLEERLDRELVRAASSEQDVSLFIVRIQNLSFASSASKRICAYLFERFQSNDMLFEYMTDGFSIIKINMTVDGALEVASSLREDIIKIIKGENMEPKCTVGISSRSMRMLPGKRLIQEAREALENAEADAASPIVAFRADADKYRKFIAEKE
ncbi:hypothetical protein HMPREF1221_00695 [Treponema socranskii subsp. paredis ATCC 35535]|nr:hypothetical protein HMPREF1221_00695 [Treponema socranskii subsp. paredis ATCC 35535]